MNKNNLSQNQLRQKHVSQTRELILEGLIRAMARGSIVDLSIPAVAREAEVSPATIYRYFRTKHELFEALGSYVAQKLGLPIHPAQGPEDLIAMTGAAFTAYENAPELLRATAMSEQSEEMRQTVMPLRLQFIEEALAPSVTHLTEAERTRLRNVILVLTTTASAQAFTNYLDLSGEEAAETVAWVIRAFTSPSSHDVKHTDADSSEKKEFS